MEREQMPEHICQHSEQVARLALALARELNASGQRLDLALLEAGALLHDIRKLLTIEQGGNHARLGARWAEESGYGEIAPMIERHVELGPWQPEGVVTEVELVNYADKRVRHTEVVSLQERFVDLLDRYGKSDGARTRIRQHWETVRKLETKIFDLLEFGPDQIS
jgi:putative nucleotidyltransferase with HDIG domain